MDEIEEAIIAGAVAALRRRAMRQARIAADGTITTERGVLIRTGEGAVARRIALVLDDLADELAAEAQS
jgi:hypothetical protein